MTDPTTVLLFLTYRRLPSFGPGGYEDWVCAEDNPFFNTIPGIRLYQNWRVEAAAGAALDFDYFDLLYLDGPGSLESVAFNEDLMRFRRGWVKRWGYGQKPSPVNLFGHILTAAEAREPFPGKDLLLSVGKAPGPAGAEDWPVTEKIVKTYAYPEGQAPEPWRSAATPDSPLGNGRLSLAPAPAGTAEPPLAPGDRFALLAHRFAPA